MELGPITPVSDLDALALEHRAAYASVNITGTGLWFVTTVPEDERWHLQNVTAAFGTIVADYNVQFTRKEEGYSGNVRTFVLSDTQVDGARVRVPYEGLILYPGDAVSVNVTAYTSGGTASSMAAAYLLENCQT